MPRLGYATNGVIRRLTAAVRENNVPFAIVEFAPDGTVRFGPAPPPPGPVGAFEQWEDRL